MTKPGRIPCINPDCRCTAPAEKYPEGTRIVCRKCWQSVPKCLRVRYSQINKRSKKIERLAPKLGKYHCRQHARMHRMIDRLHRANWAKIERYITDRPAPVGLENFLAEIGIAG